MDETINKETVESSPGAEETPSPQTSEAQAAPSAVDEESLKSILEPMIQAEVEKRTQSIKDKRIAKQESRISTLEDTIAQLKELQAEGMSEKQAIQYMRMQELLESQGISPPETPPEREQATQPSVAGDELLSSVLKLAGLKDTDADVIDILRAEKDPARRVIAINSLVETRRQAQQTPANPAAAMSTGGGQAVETDTLESVEAELTRLMKNPTENIQKLREVRKKHAELLKQQ